jgi:alpha-tubulin suppressor-like RCC1 family protein
MKNYGEAKSARFSLSIPVLLLIVLVMILTSGCSTEDSQNISGQVTAGGAPLSGVTITMTGAVSTSATTIADGSYSFSNIQSGTIILTPTLNNYTFSPPSRRVLLRGIDFSGLNFSGYFKSQLATSNHTVYVKNDGTVWTWGSNSNGQLGDGTTADKLAPLQVSSLTGVRAIAAGSAHSVALKADGTVWVWGSNSNGQLGDGTTIDKLTPVPVSNLAGITAIAAGSAHTLALKNDGTVWAWGSNSNGQLGDGTTTQRLNPVQVSILAGIVAIAAGNSHSLALRNIIALQNDVTVWAWGSNNRGQLGDGTIVDKWIPIQVFGITGVSDIAAGSFHSVALRNIFNLTNDGTVWAWGSNSNGQLGDGTIVDKFIPTMVSGLSLMTTVAAGFNHTIALRNNDTTWTWGGNSNGQLGDGTQIDRPIPLPVNGLTGVTAIAAGNKDNVVLTNRNSSTFRAWGLNNKGQLGDGTTTDKLIPASVVIP